MSLVRWVAFGAAAGLGYGAALRAWMRLVSTDPGFSWSGTGFILGAFTVLGTMAGLVSAGRRRGWGRRLVGIRGVGIVLSLGCFGGAGILMLPTVVPGALGWARTDWIRPVRAGLVAVAGVAAVAVVVTLPDLGLLRRLLALALYLLLCLVEAALTARLYAPTLPAGSLGRRVALVPLLAGVLIIGLVVMLRGV